MPQMNRAAEMQKYIGKTCEYKTLNGITVFCTINDVRSVYGSTQALIIPVAGKGSAWVSLFKLNIQGV